jgi:hypothetical protein
MPEAGIEGAFVSVIDSASTFTSTGRPLNLEFSNFSFDYPASDISTMELELRFLLDEAPIVTSRWGRGPLNMTWNLVSSTGTHTLRVEARTVLVVGTPVNPARLTGTATLRVTPGVIPLPGPGGTPTTPGETPPIIVPPPPAPESLVPVRDTGTALLEQVNFKRLAQLRPPDEESQESFKRLAEEFGREPEIVLAVMDLLVMVERRYDPALWPTLAALGERTPKFRDGLAGEIAAAERDVLTSKLVMQLGQDLGLDETTLFLWPRIDAQ